MPGIFLTFIPAAFLVWALQRWNQSRPRFEHPLWRSYTAFTAPSFGTGSMLLWMFWMFFTFRAASQGGFLVYAPVLERAGGLGALLALTGFVISLPGKGKLQWPACGLSVLMTLLGAMAGLSE